MKKGKFSSDSPKNYIPGASFLLTVIGIISLTFLNIPVFSQANCSCGEITATFSVVQIVAPRAERLSTDSRSVTRSLDSDTGGTVTRDVPVGLQVGDRDFIMVDIRNPKLECDCSNDDIECDEISFTTQKVTRRGSFSTVDNRTRNNIGQRLFNENPNLAIGIGITAETQPRIFVRANNLDEKSEPYLLIELIATCRGDGCRFVRCRGFFKLNFRLDPERISADDPDDPFEVQPWQNISGQEMHPDHSLDLNISPKEIYPGSSALAIVEAGDSIPDGTNLLVRAVEGKEKIILEDTTVSVSGENRRFPIPVVVPLGVEPGDFVVEVIIVEYDLGEEEEKKEEEDLSGVEALDADECEKLLQDLSDEVYEVRNKAWQKLRLASLAHPASTLPCICQGLDSEDLDTKYTCETILDDIFEEAYNYHKNAYQSIYMLTLFKEGLSREEKSAIMLTLNLNKWRNNLSENSSESEFYYHVRSATEGKHPPHNAEYAMFYDTDKNQIDKIMKQQFQWWHDKIDALLKKYPMPEDCNYTPYLELKNILEEIKEDLGK